MFIVVRIRRCTLYVPLTTVDNNDKFHSKIFAAIEDYKLFFK